MDERTKLELIQQLKSELNGSDESKDPENVRYIRERNAIESLENRTSEAEKEEEEALFRDLLNQRRQR